MLAYYGTRISPHMTDTLRAISSAVTCPSPGRVIWSTERGSWAWKETRTAR